jgi:putative tryptophan/tyrosine transport system substrate-binding protein
MQFVQRREFITLLGGAVGWPVGVRAQQSRMPVIGLLSGSSPGGIPHLMTAFRRGLADAGFIEGQNVEIDSRWADGRFDRLPEMAVELVRRQVALIAALGPSAPLAAKAATNTIPIVFHSGGDVVKSGLVVSLNRPGGNATGVNLFTQAVESKKLDLLSKLLPAPATLAFLLNPKNPAAEEKEKEMQDAARGLGRELRVVSASTSDEIDAAFVRLVQERVAALVIMADQYFDDSMRAKFIALAARNAIPAIYGQREYAVEGGLISYGTNLAETHRQAGNYAGRILGGAKPDDLPVLRPTKFEMVINLKTARTLSLDIPAGVLAIADEVVE